MDNPFHLILFIRIFKTLCMQCLQVLPAASPDRCLPCHISSHRVLRSCARTGIPASGSSYLALGVGDHQQVHAGGGGDGQHHHPHTTTLCGAVEWVACMWSSPTSGWHCYCGLQWGVVCSQPKHVEDQAEADLYVVLEQDGTGELK